MACKKALCYSDARVHLKANRLGRDLETTSCRPIPAFHGRTAFQQCISVQVPADVDGSES